MAVDVKGIRGKDRAKLFEGWKDAKVVGEFDEGYKLIYLSNPYDLETLGKTMGHCSGTHFVWACEEKIWYFFAIVDKNGIPHSTVHAKVLEWKGKEHPRDTQEKYPDKLVLSQVWSNRRGYPGLSTVEAAFKEVGLKYEPGKWAAPVYNSRTYENNIGYEREAQSFEYRFFNPFENSGRPEEIPEELFEEFSRCWKAMKDAWDAKNGNFQISGRTFKFDQKNLIVISHTDKSQQPVQGKMRNWFRDWLNQHQKHVKGES